MIDISKIFSIRGMKIGIFIFFLLTVYNGYATYTDYQEGDLFGTTLSAFNTGSLFMTFMYYSIISLMMVNQARVSIENERLRAELRELKRGD